MEALVDSVRIAGIPLLASLITILITLWYFGFTKKRPEVIVAVAVITLFATAAVAWSQHSINSSDVPAPGQGDDLGV